MLRKFKIKIDGNEYFVEMEDLNPQAAALETATPSVTENTVQNQTPKENKVAEKPAQQSAASGGEGQEVPAPMPGNIVKINVEVGQKVKKDEPLLVLEAMKLENEIVASQDGEVTGINVQKGDNVSAGDVLLTIK